MSSDLVTVPQTERDPQKLNFALRQVIERCSPLSDSISSVSTRVTTLEADLSGFWINVKSYGAVADNATDNATAFSNAYTALVAAGGGTLFFPGVGIYRASSFPSIVATSQPIRLLGDGVNRGDGYGTTLAHTATSGDFIAADGVGYFRIENMSFAPVNRKTSGYEISITGGFACSLSRVRIDKAFNGIYVLGSDTYHFDQVEVRRLLGTRAFLYEGDATHGGGGLSLRESLADLGSGNQSKTWAISTAFSLDDVVKTNGKFYICSTAGTSLGSGTGPSGFPSGTTAASAFSGTISDGTAAWQFLFADGATGFELGSYVGSVTMYSAVFLGGLYGIKMTDATAAHPPSFLTMFDVECDGVQGTSACAIRLERGSTVLASNIFVGNCRDGDGIQIGANFSGVVSIGNSTIGGNAGDGINIAAGGSHFIFNNNMIGGNGFTGSGSGISISGAVTHVVIQGNRMGLFTGVSNTQQHAVFTTADASDYLVITDNDMQGNTVSAMTWSSTGTHNIVRDNISYNPVGVTAAANVGVSPATITAGASPETHYVRQASSANAEIAKGGQRIHKMPDVNTSYPVQLEPNESYVVTWTTTQPTYTKDVH